MANAMASTASASAGSITREIRHLTDEAGHSLAYEIGTLVVPEVRGRPDSRRITVGFARIPAAASAGPLPTFHLPGGPGSSYLGALDPKTDADRIRLRELLAYRAVGEVILLDQRGWSARGEMLRFAPRLKAPRLDQPACLASASQAFVEAARAAVAANPDRDLAGYSVLECADDVDDLRQALGYEKIILVGQSFGSQWSLAVMRRHAGTVARALLSGLEPLDHAYDMPSHVFAALQRIAWDADRDPALAPYLPRGGVTAALQAVRARLAPGAITVPVRDPRDGTRGAVTLGAEDFQRALLRPAEAWPGAVLAIFHRHYQAWATEVLDERTAATAELPLIAPLIDTSLGVTAAREHLLRTDPAGESLGWWDFDAYAASAAVWPSPDVGDGFRTPVVDPTPVVFLSGDWDTATPIENMQGLLPYFPNGRAVLVHRGTHAVRAVLAERKSPVIDRILDFLRTGETDHLPVAITLPAPAFDLPPGVRPDRVRT